MATIIKGSNMPSDNSYGQNGFSGASSDTPNQRTRAPLTVNNDDTDAALAQVKSLGAGPRDPLTHSQLRTVAGSRPTTFGQHPSTPADSPKIPGSLDTHSDLAQKPRR